MNCFWGYFKVLCGLAGNITQFTEIYRLKVVQIPNNVMDGPLRHKKCDRDVMTQFFRVEISKNEEIYDFPPDYSPQSKVR